MKNKFLIILAAFVAAICASIGTSATARTALPDPFIIESLCMFQVWNNSGIYADEFRMVLKGIHTYDLNEGNYYPYNSSRNVYEDEESVHITWTLGTQPPPPSYSSSQMEQQIQSEMFGFALNKDISITGCEMQWVSSGEIIETIDDVWQNWEVSGSQINAVITNHSPVDRYIHKNVSYSSSSAYMQYLSQIFMMSNPPAPIDLQQISASNSLYYDFTSYMWSGSFYMFYEVYQDSSPEFWNKPIIRFANAVNMAPPSGKLTFSKYADIANAIIEPEDVDNTPIPLICARVDASSFEDVTLNDITLYNWNDNQQQQSTGTIDVWIDTDADGAIDPGSEPIASMISLYPENGTTIKLTQTIPAGSGLNLLISYTFPEDAAVGDQIGFSLGSAFATGITTGYDHIPVSGLSIESASRIISMDPISISEAKMLPINPETGYSELFMLENKTVTAYFQSTTGLAYLEEDNRSSGIGVLVPDDNQDPLLNLKITIMGRLMLLNETELVIEPTYGAVTSNTLPLTPIAMNNKATGGGAFGNQPGVLNNAFSYPVTEATGLNNVGLLVRTWGNVTGFGEIDMDDTTYNCMWIDDGSGLWDSLSSNPGIAVVAPDDWNYSNTPTGTFLITGIMRTIPNENGYPVRLLLPRSMADLSGDYIMPQ